VNAWELDCKHYWGKTLTGEKAHWCPEFDDLPIDETCDEFKWCECYGEKETATEV
jgi:hypothetical protein